MRSLFWDHTLSFYANDDSFFLFNIHNYNTFVLFSQPFPVYSHNRLKKSLHFIAGICRKNLQEISLYAKKYPELLAPGNILPNFAVNI